MWHSRSSGVHGLAVADRHRSRRWPPLPVRTAARTRPCRGHRGRSPSPRRPRRARRRDPARERDTARRRRVRAGTGPRRSASAPRRRCANTSYRRSRSSTRAGRMNMVADYSPSRPGPYAGRMRSSHRSRWRWGIPVLVAAVALVGIGAASAGSTTQPPGRRDHPRRRRRGRRRTGRQWASYVPGSSVWRHGRHPAAAWRPPSSMRTGPGWRTDGCRARNALCAMAERALLDLHLMIRPNGALIAANRYHWRYVWPRDSSFAVVTLSATGHHADAERILRFLADVAPDSGLWHARYLPDGSGDPPTMHGCVSSTAPAGCRGRWFWLETYPDWRMRRRWRAISPRWSPTPPTRWRVRWTRTILHPDAGLLGRTVHCSRWALAAPARLGLRAAAALAPTLGVDGSTWRGAARRLDVEREFGAASAYGRRRVPRDRRSPRISAVARAHRLGRRGRHLLAPPFAARDVDIRARRSRRPVAVPNGGLRPGVTWQTDVDVAWTPTTALFALASAANADPADAEAQDLARRTQDAPGRAAGEGERVRRAGSVAPLSWTGSSGPARPPRARVRLSRSCRPPEPCLPGLAE